MLFDTGSPTLVESRYASEAGIFEKARSVDQGKLIGAHGTAEAGRKLEGNFEFEIGGFGKPLKAKVAKTWVFARNDQSTLTQCFEGGSLGLDAFAGCELAQSSDAPPSLHVRCRDGATLTEAENQHPHSG
jgi:hypothetical protein